MPSVIIPAHNEARTIDRLLDALLDGPGPHPEILVVCNGCTDDTAAVARRRSPQVQVLDLERPSKHWALVEGDRVATSFPRLYVDADVELDGAGAAALFAALAEPGVLAVAPERELVLDRSSWLVRSYYRVWEQLPVVRTGLFGRGVIGVSAEGHERIADRAEVMGDDLYVHSRYTDEERRIVAAARSRVYGPRSVADLIRRRTRAAQGNAELGATGAAAPSTGGSARALVQLVRRRPGLAIHVPSFLAVTVLGRVNHRRRQRAGRAGEWLRDESSRS